MHLPSTSAMQTQARVLAFRPRYTTKDVRRRLAACSSSVLAAFVIAVIASSVVNNCTVSTDEAVPEAPSIIDTEAAVRHRYLINHDDVGGPEGKNNSPSKCSRRLRTQLSPLGDGLELTCSIILRSLPRSRRRKVLDEPAGSVVAIYRYPVKGLSAEKMGSGSSRAQ